MGMCAENEFLSHGNVTDSALRFQVAVLGSSLLPVRCKCACESSLVLVLCPGDFYLWTK